MSIPSEASTKRTAPPPPPPRRGISSYPVAAASDVSSKVQNTWNGSNSAASSSNLSLSQPQNNAYSTTSSQQNPIRSNDSALGLNGGNGNGQGLNKKEQLWRQRWARAEKILDEKGVVLRSWRVGGDVMDEAERLVKKAGEREEYEGSRERWEKRKM
jgi:hypothetical protein